jgi:hypothetical protein
LWLAFPILAGPLVLLLIPAGLALFYRQGRLAVRAGRRARKTRTLWRKLKLLPARGNRMAPAVAVAWGLVGLTLVAWWPTSYAVERASRNVTARLFELNHQMGRRRILERIGSIVDARRSQQRRAERLDLRTNPEYQAYCATQPPVEALGIGSGDYLSSLGTLQGAAPSRNEVEVDTWWWPWQYKSLPSFDSVVSNLLRNYPSVAPLAAAPNAPKPPYAAAAGADDPPRQPFAVVSPLFTCEAGGPAAASVLRTPLLRANTAGRLRLSGLFLASMFVFGLALTRAHEPHKPSPAYFRGTLVVLILAAFAGLNLFFESPLQGILFAALATVIPGLTTAALTYASNPGNVARIKTFIAGGP